MDKYLEHLYRFNLQLDPRALHARRLEVLRQGKRPDAVVVVGMGGSGLAGDAVRALRNKIGLNYPVEVFKSSKIPKLPFKNPFYIFVSFSGNTAETIGALKGVLGSKKSCLAIVTTGGKLGTIAKQNKLPIITFSAPDLTPREGLGYTYNALKKLLLVRFPSSIKSFGTPKFGHKNLEAYGKSLAGKLRNKLTLVYSQEKDLHLGKIWKATLNETGGLPAFCNTFPEVAHNEIVSFENQLSKKSHILFLAPPLFKADKESRRANVFMALARKEGIASNIISLEDHNPEEVMWNSFLLAHYTSHALAKLNKKNPFKTKLIDKFKKLTR